MAMRFENGFFESWWNRQYVANVQITFKEDFGVEGRAGYFDQYGIIRDVIQNHLLQVGRSITKGHIFICVLCLAQLMTLIAMEKPVSKHPDDIRDEKLKVLRCVKPLAVDDCVIGPYSYVCCARDLEVDFVCFRSVRRPRRKNGILARHKHLS